MDIKNMKEDRGQRADRLSSLPDDILIDVLTRLPLKLSVVTGCLSARWNGLWTNLTSIHMNECDFTSLTELITAIDEIAAHITSPYVHSFSVQFGILRSLRLLEMPTEKSVSCPLWEPSMDCWLRQICERNIRQLKVTRPYWGVTCQYRFPGYIFQTQSLVSIELDLIDCLPFDYHGDAINLPNLKNLILIHSSSHCEFLGKLIKACPSLEELSLNPRGCLCFPRSKLHIRCSNQNVRRLVTTLGKDSELMIDAPKLEYLDIQASKYAIFCFEKKPMLLREVIIVNFAFWFLKKEIKSKIYKAVKGVASHVFHNLTRLTLDTNIFDNIINLLTLVESCLGLECLTLQFRGVGEDKNSWVLPEPANKLPRLLKIVDIKIYSHTYQKHTKYCFDLTKYLLRNTTNLEHFYFSIEECGLESDDELVICKLLYRCSIVSTGCDTKFIGRFFKMSSKAGPKAYGKNGEIIFLN